MSTLQPIDNFLIRRATEIAIATITLFMASVVAIFYYQSEARESARTMVRHTYEVIGHIQQLMAEVGYMPQAALDATSVDYIVGPEQIASLLLQLSAPRKEETYGTGTYG